MFKAKITINYRIYNPKSYRSKTYDNNTQKSIGGNKSILL